MRDEAGGELIAAISTALGDGGVAIVRMSGTGAKQALARAFTPARAGAFLSGKMRFGRVTDADGRTLDEVLAVYFRAPHTYTREDVAEIHCHGGRACARAVLSRVLELGARAAQPGEFTKRAFLNGRIDLSEAEAVMALVGARSEAARRASVRQLTGGVSARVYEARRELISLIALIEACTDFPEEVEEQAAAKDVRARTLRVIEALRARTDEKKARVTREGASVVIAGKPNVGKSSLMNALLHAERAIVTGIPGTTRDVLTESMELMGVKLTLSDTAGLRETQDEVEAIGVQRAKDALLTADCVILVIDASVPLSPEDEALLSKRDARYIVALNKCDLGACAGVDGACVSACTGEGIDGVYVSARTGEGVDALSECILCAVEAARVDDDALISERHIACAKRAITALTEAVRGLDARVPLDFAASDLSRALIALGEITGETLSENVIDEVFAKFCVGK